MRVVDLGSLGHRLTDWLPPKVKLPVLIAWRALNRWLDDGGPLLGASIAFYTMFALAPLLVVCIAVAGMALGPEAARGQIVGEIEGLVGTSAAHSVQAMIESAWREPAGPLAAVLGIGTLLLGATGVFAQLRMALNIIGRVRPQASALGTFLRVRLIAFALVLGLGFLAIVSLVLSAVVSGIAGYLSARFPWWALLMTVLDLALSVLVLTTAFSALLRWLPDRPASPRGTWLSAVTSAVLFAGGKALIGMYLGRASVSSSYGAAGSFVVVMLWVYYSSQILLYGAAVGRVYDETLASGDAHAPPVDQAAAASSSWTSAGVSDSRSSADRA